MISILQMIIFMNRTYENNGNSNFGDKLYVISLFGSKHAMFVGITIYSSSGEIMMAI